MQNSSQIFGTDARQKQQQKYKKIKILGQGSMGRAYLVQCAQDQKLYVMKRINIGHLNPKQKQLALLQAQFYNCLNHPNVIGFKQVYQTTGQKLCMILQYASGGDLQQFIQQQNNKLLPQSTILNMFSQLCLGLNQVHSKQIIHRDLKTANIFLTKQKQVKIGDFGISKRMDRSYLAATSMIGTPYYLSPQMVEGKPYSQKADIWALGVILYQLCSFKFPFQASSLPVLALKIIKGAFPPIPNQYSKQLKALILQMLQVDQKKRPSIQSILLKSILSKYVSKQNITKITMKQQQKKQKIKQKQINKNQKIQIEKQKINDKKQQLKKQNIQKRQEIRKQMRQDLKKKRAQNTKQKQYVSQTGSNFPTNNNEQSKNISIKTQVSSFRQDKKQQPIKPWKIKAGNKQKKQISVQLFVPNLKQKQSNKNQEQNINSNIKIQMYLPKNPKPLQQSISQGRKSAPLIDNVQSNYHYSQSNKHISEQSDEEQVEEDINDNDSQTMQDMLRNLQQITKNFPTPSKPIQLYEQSQVFEATIPTKQKIKQPTNQKQQNIHLSSQNLQQLRIILQQRLGQQLFLSSYNIVKQHVFISQHRLTNISNQSKTNNKNKNNNQNNAISLINNQQDKSQYFQIIMNLNKTQNGYILLSCIKIYK